MRISFHAGAYARDAARLIALILLYAACLMPPYAEATVDAWRWLSLMAITRLAGHFAAILTIISLQVSWRHISAIRHAAISLFSSLILPPVFATSRLLLFRGCRFQFDTIIAAIAAIFRAFSAIASLLSAISRLDCRHAYAER
jgi:hypothetical protein